MAAQFFVGRWTPSPSSEHPFGSTVPARSGRMHWVRTNDSRRPSPSSAPRTRPPTTRTLPPTSSTLPPTARAIATIIDAAVTAALSADAEALALATARLSTQDVEQVQRVLSAVLRPLLEDLHPDGLTGDDLRTAALHCVRQVSGWLRDVDPQVFVGVLAGAFGVHPQDDDPPGALAPEVARHACLLVADLLSSSEGRLRPYLDAAFVEIARAETQDDG